jgi:hypothetical protein
MKLGEVSEDSFGIPKPSVIEQRRPSRKIFAIADKTASQMRDPMDIGGASGRAGGPVEIREAKSSRPPIEPIKETSASSSSSFALKKADKSFEREAEDKVHSLRSPSSRGGKNSKSFDDFDGNDMTTSTHLAQKMLSTATSEDGAASEFEFDDIPMVDFDGDDNKSTNNISSTIPQKALPSPRHNTMNSRNMNTNDMFDSYKPVGASSSSSLEAKTPRGKTSPTSGDFDFGIEEEEEEDKNDDDTNEQEEEKLPRGFGKKDDDGDGDDDDDDDNGGGGGGGEFDWMMPSGSRRNSRPRRGRLNAEKPKAGVFNDFEKKNQIS